MFKKLESILSARFAQFQPRSLIEVLHACIHLERFPLNYMAKVFGPHFLQRLRGETTLAPKIPPDRIVCVCLPCSPFPTPLSIHMLTSGDVLKRAPIRQQFLLFCRSAAIHSQNVAAGGVRAGATACNVRDVSCPCLRYSTGRAIGQDRTGSADAASSLLLVRVLLLLGECHRRPPV